jgi:DMSO/TMAO reductase YedYZ molybdopterin-dependent catalytic subunit
MDERRVATERFFTRSHFPIPPVDPRTWRLTLAGDMRWPGRFGLTELDRRPQRSVVAVLECAGNSRRRFGRVADGEVPWGDGAVSVAEWTGVPLREILRDAGVHASAREIVFEGADAGGGGVDRPNVRFARSLPVDVALGSPDILIATAMNGAPLDPDHGAPARLLVPGWYGMASVKWLVRIEAIDHPFSGPFQTERYVYRRSDLPGAPTTPVSRLRVKSLIVSPREAEQVPLGTPAVIRGRAWSGSEVVAQVDVDVGDGWQPARLAPGAAPHEWVAWSKVWTPRTLGPAEIAVRATDGAGYTQPDAPEPNDFQYGFNAIHRVRVDVVDPATAAPAEASSGPPAARRGPP